MDVRNLLQILPDELLEAILTYINSLTDLSSVSKCSARCSKILHPNKPVFLFPETVPHLSIYLSKPDILNLRNVCLAWKIATDKYLESSNQFNNEAYFRRNSPFWPRRSRSITDFVNTMSFHRDKNLNPFPGRRVAFGRIRREAPDFDYWFNVSTLLNQFGSHLHSVRFDFEDIPFEKFLQVLTTCLEHLPNLRNLHIIYFGRPSAHSHVPRIIPVLVPGHWRLEYLELNGTFPENFYENIILTLSPSLLTLQLHQEPPEPISLQKLHCLNSLEIYGNTLNGLRRLLPNSKVLQVLSVHTVQHIGLLHLFKILQVFESSLKSLTISSTNSGVKSDLPELPVFPNLKRLKLKNLPLNVLNRLESFPQLEALDFECLHVGDEVTPGFDVPIYGAAPDDMYNSKIWCLLPKLQTFRINTYQLGTGKEFTYRYNRVKFDYIYSWTKYKPNDKNHTFHDLLVCNKILA